MGVAPASTGMIGSFFQEMAIFDEPSVKNPGEHGLVNLSESGSDPFERLVGLKLGPLGQVFSHNQLLVELAVLDRRIIL